MSGSQTMRVVTKGFGMRPPVEGEPGRGIVSQEDAAEENGVAVIDIRHHAARGGREAGDRRARDRLAGLRIDARHRDAGIRRRRRRRSRSC